jgi:pimeloyl-ACP methyl ester carboxylesterase
MPTGDPVGAGDGSIAVESLDIHGQRIVYRRAGAGPVVLLLHGIAGSSATWEPVMRRLAGTCTVVAPDFIGHGASDKPLGDYSLGAVANWTRDLLDALGIARATVVGQSFGGGVALQFAYQFPDRCERVVLVDAGGLGREVNWILRLIAVPGAELVLPVLFPSFAAGVGDSVARTLRRWGVSRPAAAEVWSAYRSLTDAPTRRAFVRTIRAVIDPGGQSISAHGRLHLTEGLPVLIVWGGRDRIIPVDHAYRAADAIPHSKLEVLPGLGHFPQTQDPEAVAELILGFMASTVPRPPTGPPPEASI